jgi:hypothetical protein
MRTRDAYPPLGSDEGGGFRELPGLRHVIPSLEQSETTEGGGTRKKEMLQDDKNDMRCHRPRGIALCSDKLPPGQLAGAAADPTYCT